MRALSVCPMSRPVILGVLLCFGVSVPAWANVITDWDEKAVAAVTPLMASLGANYPVMAQRIMAMVHTAMFDSVNSIERRYRPYLIQLPAERTTSEEAAAATAAAEVLATISPKTANEIKVALTTYLATIPDGPAKLDGIKLGEAVGARVIAGRENDGCYEPDDYRPRTTAGVYVPTPITAASMWPKLKPFAIVSGSQFRPGPPISLESKEWATDFNELKDYGAKISPKRTDQMTETARFWLMVGPQAYHPFAR